MSRLGLTLCVLAVPAALAGGFWLGRHGPGAPVPVPPPPPSAAVSTPAVARPILYYQHPDGQPDYSPTPKKDEKGRDYLPVLGDPEPESPPPPAAAKSGKILYYRNPMGLPDTSPTPKKDSMGMDYVPVYDGEDNGDTVSVSPGRVQTLGVQSEPVSRRLLTRSLRTNAVLQLDERGLSQVTPRFEGYIETLLINQTGVEIKAGQPLMTIYSPDLLLAEQDYQAALRGAQSLSTATAEEQAAARALAEGALARLRNWSAPSGEISRLQKGGAPSRTITLTAPAAGVVVDKKAVQGLRFMPGDVLFQLADVSTLWLIADVFEQDLSSVQLGQKAEALFPALPGERFSGKVTFIAPVLNPETRTAKVRIELANPDRRLRPAMFGTADLTPESNSTPLLTVPDSAVIDSGRGKTVLVEKAPGRYSPRSIETGRHGDGFVEILSGLREGENVVIKANFLIDAESNLRSALKGLSAGATGDGK